MTGLTADDALRLTAELTEWLTTPDAARIQVDIWERDDLRVKEMLGPPLEVSADVNAGLSHRLKDTTPIWCDRAMVDLLAAAAAAFPDQAIRSELLLPPMGIMVFAKPLPLEWLLNDRQTVRKALPQTQVITWDLLKGDTFYLANAWYVAAPAVVNVPGHGKARIRRLWPGGCNELWFKTPPPEQRNDSHEQAILRLLNAFAGLCRTPLVQEDTKAASSKARRATARSKLANPLIRRLYLRHPEAGQEELNALRRERAGSPRGHWVRGHWKNQWFSSVEEHRPTWIEGYPRGDFTKGEVTGEAVLVAKSSATEVNAHQSAELPADHARRRAPQ